MEKQVFVDLDKDAAYQSWRRDALKVANAKLRVLLNKNFNCRLNDFGTNIVIADFKEILWRRDFYYPEKEIKND